MYLYLSCSSLYVEGSESLPSGWHLAHDASCGFPLRGFVLEYEWDTIEIVYENARLCGVRNLHGACHSQCAFHRDCAGRTGCQSSM